jgi:hypothetical protein
MRESIVVICPTAQREMRAALWRDGQIGHGWHARVARRAYRADWSPPGPRKAQSARNDEAFWGYRLLGQYSRSQKVGHSALYFQFRVDFGISAAGAVIPYRAARDAMYYTRNDWRIETGSQECESDGRSVSREAHQGPFGRDGI